jgi:hypothetical protein
MVKDVRRLLNVQGSSLCSQWRSHVVHAHFALTAYPRTCNSAADLALISHVRGNQHPSYLIHSVPSTSNTIPFSAGLLSPSFLLAGSRGANRRGRTGCAIELSIHTLFGRRV